MNECAPNPSHTKIMLLILYTKANFLFLDLCFLALSLTAVPFFYLCLKRKYLFSVMAQECRELTKLTEDADLIYESNEILTGMPQSIIGYLLETMIRFQFISKTDTIH